MRIKHLLTLLLLAHIVVLANVLLPTESFADTRPISCTNWDDPNTRECTGISDAELRSLVKDLGEIEDCKTQLENSTDPFPSCDTESFTCVLLRGDPDNGASCNIKGTGDTESPLFNVSCTAIDASSATCSITNNIGTLAGSVNNPTSNIGSLLTGPQVVLATTLISACENRFTISPGLQRDCDILLTLLDDAANNADPNAAAQSASKAAALIAVITPDGASAAIDVSQTAIRAQNRNIAQRINELRRAAKNNEQVSFNGLKFRSNGKLIDMAELYPELKEASGGGASADSLGGRLGFFINGMLDDGKKDTSENELGFSFSGGELTTGVDYRLRDNMFAGLAFGFSSNTTDLNNNRGSLDSLAYNLIVYGSVFPTPNAYLDANVIIGGGQFDQKRNIQYIDPANPGNNIDQVAEAKYFGEQFSLSLSAGYDFARGAMTMSPYGTLLHVKSQTDGYNENVSDVNAPGAGFALSIGDQDYTSTTLALGGQFTYALKYGWGVMVPQLKLEWIKEFDDDIQVVTGHFIGDPNEESFRLPTDKPDDAYFLFGLGTTGIVPGGQTFYVYYQTYFGYEDLDYYSLNFGLRWEFE